MEKLLYSDEPKREMPEGLIHKISASVCGDVHFGAPMSSLRISEADLVRSVLQALQGLSSSLIFWDQNGQMFRAKSGIYISHLSQMSLHNLLNEFICAATWLKFVESVVGRLKTSLRSPPTLRAFSSSVSAWLQILRDIALKEEAKISNSEIGVTPTLLGLTSSLSSLCSGAEYLLQIVRGAIPHEYLECGSSISAAEIAVHVLDYLYKKLDEVCLVQGGEEEPYNMLLQIFTGSLLPYIEGLDSWLFEGTLDDPFQEMFFYAKESISVNEAEFWERSYLLRWVHSQKLNFTSLNDKKGMGGNDSNSSPIPCKEKGQNNREVLLCPLFIKDICQSIVSAGKSLQLIRHIPSASSGNSAEIRYHEQNAHDSCVPLVKHSIGCSIADLSLSEVFCLTLAGLVGHGDHVSRYIWKGGLPERENTSTLGSYISGEVVDTMDCKSLPVIKGTERMWYKFFLDGVEEKMVMDIKPENQSASYISDTKEEKSCVAAENALQELFCPENLVISVSKMTLERNKKAWEILNISQNYCLPPLNDESLWNAVFKGNSVPGSGFRGTDYKFGFHFGKSEYLCSQDDMKMVESLFPFPTLLPSFQEDLCISELLPFQKDSTLPSRVLCWMLKLEPRDTPLPVVIMQECLTIYIRRQVDYIGKVILSKLMNDWRLMHELAVLRAIYLLGSGDLLQHFLTVIFSRLDKGESWNDDFELNIILQGRCIRRG
ncbi:PREDICTED: gamma-tubulin complex component 5-like isoform X2 [Tarenaya hassleriana]|uniref:gamma-tubulin complex component 5-like isoform X2 n=1 Tax=Tarenaya hassleriana TaxID=28532 RepID=UPI0008FD08CD|nr:PREDICTED: gamma-tubulin complex component 5-like isoform X2 [Tarenaya hassleriana]